MFNFFKYPQNAVTLASHRYSICRTVLLSYSEVSRCSLSFKTVSLCLIRPTYYTRLSQKVQPVLFTYQRIITMSTKCITCNAIVHPLRSKLGIDTCIYCGDKEAKQRTHCIVPMHKSNYIVVTNRDDLVRINNKSG